MSYRLDLEKPVPAALRAVAVERLERALRRLREDHDADPVDAVHGARKDLKKLRAVLRLARPDMPRDVYRDENQALRDIGRGMSGGRDADVMVETSDALAERFGDQHPKREFAALRRRLESHARARQDDTDVEAPAAELEAALRRARRWPLGDCDIDTLLAGEQRTYKAGRRAFEALERSPTVEDWHEWRKRVKDHWYHQRLLADLWPGLMKAQAKECDQLGELLGDDHDLATFAATLSSSEGVEAPPSVDTEAVLDLIATRRTELQEEARALGRLVYAEKPKAHRRRLGSYLAAA